jgi:hypothetical protein
LLKNVLTMLGTKEIPAAISTNGGRGEKFSLTYQGTDSDRDPGSEEYAEGAVLDRLSTALAGMARKSSITHIPRTRTYLNLGVAEECRTYRPAFARGAAIVPCI